MAIIARLITGQGEDGAAFDIGMIAMQALSPGQLAGLVIASRVVVELQVHAVVTGQAAEGAARAQHGLQAQAEAD
jgi:hypothetical protein